MNNTMKILGTSAFINLYLVSNYIRPAYYHDNINHFTDKELIIIKELFPNLFLYNNITTNQYNLFTNKEIDITQNMGKILGYPYHVYKNYDKISYLNDNRTLYSINIYFRSYYKLNSISLFTIVCKSNNTNDNNNTYLYMNKLKYKILSHLKNKFVLLYKIIQKIKIEKKEQYSINYIISYIKNNTKPIINKKIINNIYNILYNLSIEDIMIDKIINNVKWNDTEHKNNIINIITNII